MHCVDVGNAGAGAFSGSDGVDEGRMCRRQPELSGGAHTREEGLFCGVKRGLIHAGDGLHSAGRCVDLSSEHGTPHLQGLA